jgi:hypothetical protein
VRSLATRFGTVPAPFAARIGHLRNALPLVTNLQRPAIRWTIAIPFAAHRRHDRPPRYDSEPHAESTVEM